MAGTSLLLLLDDIATVLDDVAVMTRMAAKKTAGVLGDDLALNAQQVSGVSADRELPVVWAVAKGSALNKLILVPAALAISAFAPWAVTPLLMLGGAFLCYEGFEKLAHKFLHRGKDDAGEAASKAQHRQALVDADVDLVALEKDKIKGAVRTDFILSAEIIVITLGVVADQTLGRQFTVLATIAVLMTIGVYGLVAGIVKLDDGGLWLSRRAGEGAWPRLLRWLGTAIIGLAPYLMRTLAVVGTAAMFLVGGGILTHGIAPLHHAIGALAERAGSVGGVVLPLLADALVGILAGALVLAVVSLGRRLFGQRAAAA